MAGCNFWGHQVDPVGLPSISINPKPTIVYDILHLPGLACYNHIHHVVIILLLNATIDHPPTPLQIAFFSP